MKVFYSFVVLLLASNLSVGQTSEGEWFDQKWLEDNYLLKWKTNHLEKRITFRVEVMTKGWVGFGLSKHGKTTEADMVIGWVDNWGHSTFNVSLKFRISFSLNWNQFFFQDYWVNELGNHSIDESQDWILISGEENATHTFLEFSRDYVTCDEWEWPRDLWKWFRTIKHNSSATHSKIQLMLN